MSLFTIENKSSLPKHLAVLIVSEVLAKQDGLGKFGSISTVVFNGKEYVCDYTPQKENEKFILYNK